MKDCLTTFFSIFKKTPATVGKGNWFYTKGEATHCSRFPDNAHFWETFHTIFLISEHG